MSDASGAAPALPFWRVARILYDADGLLVVDKPGGIPTYGGDEGLSHSVVARLQRHFSGLGREVELGVFQRLDQDTSGLLFFTTDGRRNQELARAMERHELERVYYAVVEPHGRRALPDGRIRLYLRHHKGKSEVFAQDPPEGAREAISHFRVLEVQGSRALMECRLETGRTHQLRATLAHLGAPIVGDRLYGGVRAARLMLHAYRLSGGALGEGFTSALPDTLNEALGRRGGALTAAQVQNRLFDACMLRAPLLERTSALRLVNGEGDGMSGLSVDMYGQFAVVNIYDAAWTERLSEIAQPLLQLGVSGLYLKQRVRADLRRRDAGELAPNEPFAGKRAPDEFVVQENGLRFYIHLHDGLSTGLFVDMRENRARLAQWMGASTDAPKTLLNLFAYTCSFSVAGARAGAITTSVDLSGKALERGRAHFALNGLDADRHRFFREDALKFLARSVRRGDRYDFIVLDPPSFSTVKKSTFSVKNSLGDAALACLQLLSPGGKLLAVTNHAKTSPQEFAHLVRDASARAGRTLRSLRVRRSTLDFPEHAQGPWPSKSLLVEVE